MAQEFSWSRLGRAIADAWLPAKEIKAVILRGVSIAVPLGYAVFASLKPEMLLPSSVVGRIVLCVIALLLFAVPVQVAYKLRSQLDDLTDRVTAIPESERKLILDLRALAGTTLHHLVKLPFADPAENKILISRLHNLCGHLRHYPGIYTAASGLASTLTRISGEMTEKSYSEVAQRAEGLYQDIVRECEAVLRPPADVPRS